AVRLFRRHLDHRQRRAGAAIEMEAQHARVVHLVDVIARQHDQVPRLLALDGIEVLEDRVRRALVPVLADALLRVQHLDELPELVGDDAPPEAEVAGERERLVLQRDEDLAQPRVQAVAQREIDDPVGAAEVDGGLGAFPGQGEEALTHASGQHHHDDVVEHGDPQRFNTTRAGAPSAPASRSGRQYISYCPASTSDRLSPSMMITPAPSSTWCAGAPAFLNCSTDRYSTPT